MHEKLIKVKHVSLLLFFFFAAAFIAAQNEAYNVAYSCIFATVLLTKLKLSDKWDAKHTVSVFLSSSMTRIQLPSR